MELKKAIIDRHSIRGFTTEPVSKEVVEDILKTAGYAVSSKNTQPWQYAVITGDILKKIGDVLFLKLIFGVKVITFKNLMQALCFQLQMYLLKCLILEV